MAFETLNPVCAIWQGFGLRYLLARPYPARALVAPQAKVVGSGQGRHSPSAAPRQVEAKWQPSVTTTPETAKTARQPGFTPIPVESWPQLWQEQFKLARKGKIAWTYWNLGADLLAARDVIPAREGKAKRSRIMQRLLRELGSPAGTHTFWPAHLDPDVEPTAQPELFWSGVKFLGCRVVIMMGSKAAGKLLNQKGLRPLTQLRMHGHIVWILNDLDLLEENSANFSHVLAFLRQAMSAFIRF